MIEINTKEELQEVIGLDEISIIQMGTVLYQDTYPEWNISNIEDKYKNIKFYSLDLDKVDIADSYKIVYCPEIIAFKNGKEISRKNNENLENWIDFLCLGW